MRALARCMYQRLHQDRRSVSTYPRDARWSRTRIRIFWPKNPTISTYSFTSETRCPYEAAWAGYSGVVEGFDDRCHGFDAHFGPIGQVASDLIDAEGTETEKGLGDLIG